MYALYQAVVLAGAVQLGDGILSLFLILLFCGITVPNSCVLFLTLYVFTFIQAHPIHMFVLAQDSVLINRILTNFYLCETLE